MHVVAMPVAAAAAGASGEAVLPPRPADLVVAAV